MKNALTVSLLSLASLIFSFPTNAQTAGLQGSYMGSTLDNKGTENLLQFFDAQPTFPSSAAEALKLYTEGEKLEGQFQGRLDVPNIPISVRGVAYSSEDAKAILPMLSYDVGVTNNANIYAGAGYAFVNSSGADTPVGDRNGVVLSTGVEAKVMNNLIIFGDAKLRVNQLEGGANHSPMRFQFGVGYGF